MSISRIVVNSHPPEGDKAQKERTIVIIGTVTDDNR